MDIIYNKYRIVVTREEIPIGGQDITYYVERPDGTVIEDDFTTNFQTVWEVVRYMKSLVDEDEKKNRIYPDEYAKLKAFKELEERMESNIEVGDGMVVLFGNAVEVLRDLCLLYRLYLNGIDADVAWADLCEIGCINTSDRSLELDVFVEKIKAMKKG